MSPQLASWSLLLMLTACADPDAIVAVGDGKQAPAEAVRMAQAWLESRSQSESIAAAELQDRYLADFFEGFTAAVAQQRPKATAGFAAGIAYRREHPDRERSVMLGFGYEFVACEGEYVVGFENVWVRPKHQAGEKWWVQLMVPLPAADGDPGQIATARQVRVTRQVRVSGYLSPLGSYGHLGAYPRLLLATSMAPSQ
jgi:hypothetical protein